MRFLFALEAVMSRAGRPVWLNCVLAALILLVMATIATGSGLSKAGIVLTWLALLPLGLGVLGLADGVREEMKARA
jgi:hypothetical protein